MRLLIALALATTACADEERQARATARDTVATVEKRVDQVTHGVTSALELGRKVKTELDRVYKTSTDYDLTVTTTDADDSSAAALAAMPTITVGDLTVGYEASAGHSTTGVNRSRKFRARWRHGPRTVHVGYASSEELDAAAFAALLQKMVPIVEAQLR